MYLSAIVLVPEGFDEHPNAHYPLLIFHDHFVDGLSTTSAPSRPIRI